MEAITEKDKKEIKWYEDAKKQTFETLPGFIYRLMNDYEHDYGTICKAMAAAMLGTAHAVNDDDQGGITGFQACAVMCEFVREWNYPHNSCGLKILDYDDMLFPQHDYRFDKTISRNTFNALQELTKKRLSEMKESPVHPAVLAHWKSIVSGVVPFGYTIIED